MDGAKGRWEESIVQNKLAFFYVESHSILIIASSSVLTALR